MKFLKSNFIFILAIAFMATIAFVPKVKSLVLRQLIRTGFYEPDVSHIKLKAVKLEDKKPAQVAPPALFRSSSGETIDIGNSKGKVIFLNFWATWCPPCIAEMPTVNSLRAELKGKPVQFILADIDNNLDRSEAFMKKNKLDLPVFEPASIIPEYIFRGNVPTTVIINKQGEVVFHHEGMADYNTEGMRQLLAELAK